MTEGLEGNQPSLMRDGARSGGEGVGGNRFLQDREGCGEGFVLIFEGW
jgi:hypothetical protein